MNYKARQRGYILGQLLLQSGAAIIILQSNAVEKTNERNNVNRFWQPTSSFNSNLFGDTHFTPVRIIGKLINSVIIKIKKKSRPHHRLICVTCKLEKQLLEVFLVLKILKSCKIYRKLSITEIDYNKAACATLVKSLSAMDIL